MTASPNASVSDHDGKRTVFVAVVGMSPQIVTETLYALAVSGGALPDEVHLVTTSSGAVRATEKLLDEGRFEGFCRQFGPEAGIRFDKSMIHVITGPDGVPLNDIRTLDDNTCAADFITRTIQSFCADPNTTLLVSMAGGRKSMGFYAGYALSLFGRSDDELFHVLVSAPFETHPNFFYPTQPEPLSPLRDGTVLDARDAVVELASIPFVRMSADLTERPQSYMEAVKSAESRLKAPLQLTLDVASRSITAGSAVIRPEPGLFATYLWIAERCQSGNPQCDPDLADSPEEFLDCYEEVLGGETACHENARGALKHDDDFKPYFRQKRAVINKLLQKELGAVLSKPYLIESVGRGKLYQLSLPPESVEIIRDASLAFWRRSRRTVRPSCTESPTFRG